MVNGAILISVSLLDSHRDRYSLPCFAVRNAAQRYSGRTFPMDGNVLSNVRETAHSNKKPPIFAD